MWTFLFFLLFIGLIVFINTFMVVTMREAVIKERLGKYVETLSPGLHFMVPFVDRAAYRHEMREQVLDVPSQSCITRDNIQVEVDGLVYIKVTDPYKASYGIGDYKRAAVNLAQTTMRSEIGKLSLDNTFSERDSLNDNIVLEVDKASDPWGIKVLRYEIRNIDPSREVINTLEQQMEAERQKRAEITHSSGEKQARINMSEAERQKEINISEGEKIRRINIAEGKAKEISLITGSIAAGTEKIAAAIASEGGEIAAKTQLTEQYINQLGEILSEAQVSVLPAEMANLKATFEGLSKVTDKVVTNY